MAELKTKPTDQRVETFLSQITDDKKRQDCFTVLELMKEVTGMEPKMWGNSIVGFGRYHYKYESGREGDWFLTGFSPRKQDLTLYIISGFAHYEDLLNKLGKAMTGKSCLYVRTLAEIDLQILRELVRQSVENVAARYKTNGTF